MLRRAQAAPLLGDASLGELKKISIKGDRFSHNVVCIDHLLWTPSSPSNLCTWITSRLALLRMYSATRSDVLLYGIAHFHIQIYYAPALAQHSGFSICRPPHTVSCWARSWTSIDCTCLVRARTRCSISIEERKKFCAHYSP